MDSIKFVRFNNSKNKDFVKELNKRVNQYFTDNRISKFSNLSMVFKTIFMLSLYFVPFILILTQVFDSLWMFFLLQVLVGLGMSGIGLSIMHDANHGSYSKNKRINSIISYCMNMIGGSSVGWRIQHNVLHHTYTNVVGLDEDISPPTSLLRFTKKEKLNSLHRFQFLYAWILYGFMTLEWMVVKDFKDLIRYNKSNLLAGQKTSYAKEFRILLVTKVVYFSYILLLPILVTDYPIWIVILGFVTMHFVGGLFLTMVFQCAHVQIGTEFKDNENSQIDENFHVHQLSTTVNFAKNNRLFSWFVGGLNFQVEHHLYPNICHVHYRKISDIVKKTANEYSMPYHEITSFTKAIFLHHKMLYNLGRE